MHLYWEVTNLEKVLMKQTFEAINSEYLKTAKNTITNNIIMTIQDLLILMALSCQVK